MNFIFYHNIIYLTTFYIEFVRHIRSSLDRGKTALKCSCVFHTGGRIQIIIIIIYLIRILQS